MSIEQVKNDTDKLVEPLQFQPVKSPNNYEAEFAVKGEDLIFHFWPYNYHEAQSNGTVLPRFRRDFSFHLINIMSAKFGSNRLQAENDEDMGSIFIRASGFGSNQFYRELAIQVCEELHEALKG